MSSPLPRILVVDDEEAILETMTFTFQDEYEVFTSQDAREALSILDANAPIAAVLTDQRMPNMSGVEFVSEVWKRHPATVRMILTGFSDMDAIIEAINDGHVYAYITKPWEPEQLKQVMKQAVEHHKLTVENERLLGGLRRANAYLEAVMDRLDTGAMAVDSAGVIQAANRPVREYLALEGELRGRPLKDVLAGHGLDAVAEAASKAVGEEGTSFDEVEVSLGERAHRLRISIQNLPGESGDSLGRVIQIREISHEPLQRRFHELLGRVVEAVDELRPTLVEARDEIRRLGDSVQTSRIASPGMGELAERVSRTLTAMQNWLDVDDAIAREDFPDAQLLQDRMRISMTRWPLPNEIPNRVRELARRVEEYYESGENRKQHTL